MIVVNIVLKSARDGRTEHIGSLAIVNDGTGTNALRNYDVTVFSRGQSPREIRHGRVEQHRAEAEPVFALVAKALAAAGYAPQPLPTPEPS